MPSSRGASSLLRLCVLAVALSVCAFEALPGVTAAPCTSHQTVRGRILQQKPQRRRGPRLPDDGPKQKANPRRIALQQGDDDNDDDDDDDDDDNDDDEPSPCAFTNGTLRAEPAAHRSIRPAAPKATVHLPLAVPSWQPNIKLSQNGYG